MKVLFIFLCFYVGECLSQEEMCPKEVRLVDIPVQDQDGTGTCYSNTASLMMQHKFKLKKTPSYQQMAMQTASNDGNIKNASLTKPGETAGKEDIFSASGRVCDVINSAQKEGWCDADQFSLDVIGGNDSLHSQNYFLVNFAKMLENKNSIMSRLKNTSSSEFQSLKYQLASLLMDKSRICEKSFHEFVNERLIARTYIRWRDHLNSLSGENKERFSKIMSSSFEKNGMAKQKFKEFVDKKFIEDKITYFGQKYYQDKKYPNEFIKPSKFLIYDWALENNISFSGIPLPEENDKSKVIFPYAEEAELYGSCFYKNGNADAISLFLQNPSCSHPVAVLPEKDLALAERYLIMMKDFSQASGPSEKFREFMNLVFPRCGEQLEQRKNGMSHNVLCENVKNLENKKSASILINELCHLNPVGIATCSAFLKTDNPIDSKRCNIDAITSLGQKYSIHIMTVVGYRTNNLGKHMFLVQNSWGASCPFYQENKFKKSYNDLVDCEEKEGVLTGRFWVDEDLLLNNTSYLSVLKESK